MVLIYDFFFLFRIFNANKKCVFVKFFGGIRGFLILTRDLNEIIMPAKENDIIFYFSFPGGPVVVFAKASASCVVRRNVSHLGSNPDPRFTMSVALHWLGCAGMLPAYRISFTKP